jgi:hypothetical protein
MGHLRPSTSSQHPNPHWSVNDGKDHAFLLVSIYLR